VSQTVAREGTSGISSKCLRIGIILTPEFTLNALGNFVDVLRLAADDGDRSRPIRCRWDIMSAAGRPVRASCGVDVTPTCRLAPVEGMNYVAVVGGLLCRRPQMEDSVRSYLLQAAAAGIGLIGICTGTFVLCRLGLMKGKKCCISWYHYGDFLREFDNTTPVGDQMYMVDGDRITASGGVGAALAAADLVKRHLGPSYAQKALHIMQIDSTRPGATLQPAPPMTTSSPDGRVTRVLLMMEQHISDPMSVADMAARVRTSARSLERLFKRHLGMGPHAAYLRLRIMHAGWKLRAGLSLAVIAAETGFGGVSHLSQTFRKINGYAPSQARRQISMAKGSNLPTLTLHHPRVFYTEQD
jgi:transcriptional regulator GlxA family with amidase domain